MLSTSANLWTYIESINLFSFLNNVFGALIPFIGSLFELILDLVIQIFGKGGDKDIAEEFIICHSPDYNLGGFIY